MRKSLLVRRCEKDVLGKTLSEKRCKKDVVIRRSELDVESKSL